MNKAQGSTRDWSRFANVLLLGSAMAGLCAGPVQAQDIATDPSESETITVTATRRSADILDVPYNITAVTGDEIEAARTFDTTELLRTVPGVSVVDRGQRNSATVNGVRLRGLNVDSQFTGDMALAADPTVATYVNDTPIFANLLLSDISQVEVLRGPQATLYGSGALAGTVRYTMNAPELGVFGGHMTGSASQSDGSGDVGLSGDATLNVPLGDMFALRVGVAGVNYPGLTDYVNLYVLDGTGTPAPGPGGILSSDATYRSQEDADTVDSFFGRVSLLFQPNERFDATLNYFHQDDEYGARRGQSLGADGFGNAYGDHEIGSIQLEPGQRDIDIISLEANLDLGFATLTSSTSYYDHAGSSVSENTGFYAAVGFLSTYYYNYPRPMASAVRGFTDRTFVEEIRLVSDDGGDFDYVLGVFYQDQERVGFQNSYLRGFKEWWDAGGYIGQYPGAAPADQLDNNDFIFNRHQTNTQLALFGELTWHATDRLDLTGGFRTFQNESENSTFLQSGTSAYYRAAIDRAFSNEESDTLFKVNAAYHFGDDDLLYATASEGYRRGGANALPTCPLTFCETANVDRQSFEADTVTNFELGVKGRLNGLRYDANVFHVEWKNPQLNTATPVWGFYYVANGDAAHSAGIELQLDGQFSNQWGYQFGYTYLDAVLDENFCDPSPTRPCPGSGLIDYSGNRLPGAPEHTLNASLDLTQPVGNFIFNGSLQGYYQSEVRNATSTSAFYNVTLPGFAIFNAVGTLSAESWDFSVWLKNITNEEGVTGVFTELHMGANPSEGYYGNGSKEIISLPRTLGATLAYRF